MLSVEPPLYLRAGWHSLHLSIFTATVIVESALASPYAVASTTFPNAPDPSVFPEDITEKKTVIPCPVSPPTKWLDAKVPRTTTVIPRGLGTQAPGHAGSCLRWFVGNNTQSVSSILCLP